jgi:hypothetical protein
LIHPPLSINNWYQSRLPSVQFNHWKEDPKKKWKTKFQILRYHVLKKPNTAAQKEAKRNNKFAIDTILDGSTDSVKSKVGSCASSKELWDKLQDLYPREEAEE